MASPQWPSDADAAKWRGSASDSATSEFIHAEYVHLADSLLRNEEDGEKRVTFFLTLSTGIIAAMALVLRGQDGGLNLAVVRASRGLVTGLLLIPLCVGWFTLVRIIKRNVTTDGYKLALRALRRCLVTAPVASSLANALFGLDQPYHARHFSLLPFARAGWMEIVALFNMFLAMLFVAALAWPEPPANDRQRIVALGAVALTAVLVWVAQMRFSRAAYHGAIDEIIARDETERQAWVARTKP